MISPQQHIIVAVEESDSTVGFYDSTSGNELRRVAVGRWPHEIEISLDGEFAYVSNFGLKDYDERIGEPGSSISIIDLHSFCEIDRLYTFSGGEEWERRRAPHGVKLAPNGSLYVNVERSSEMLIYDFNTSKNSKGFRLPTRAFAMPSAQSALYGRSAEGPGLRDYVVDNAFGLPRESHNFIFGRNDDSIFVASGRGGLYKISASTGQILFNLVRPGPTRGLAWSADGKCLIISAGDEICLVDPEKLTLIKSFGGLGVRQLLYSEPTPDGRYIVAPAVWEGQVLLVDAINGSVLDRLIIGADPIHVAMAPGGQSAYVSHGRSKFISEIRFDPLTEVRRIQTRGGPNGIAVVPMPKSSVLPNAPRPTIRIGACIPLSGPNSVEGQDLRLGYQYWEELVNDAGGILVGNQSYRVEVVLRDSRSEVSEPLVRSLTQDLIKTAGVEFVFGGYPSPPNLFSGRVANEHGVPFLTASGAALTIYQQGFDFVFGIMSSSNAFLKETLVFLAQQKPAPASVAFFSCDDPAASNDAKTTALAAADMGYRVITPSVEIPGTVLSGAVLSCPHLKPDAGDLQRLKETYERVIQAFMDMPPGDRPDVFVQTGHLAESIALVEVAKTLNFVPQAFAFSVGPAFPQFATALGDAALNMFNSAMWSAVQREFGHDRFVRPEDFARRFFERFSKQPSYLAAGAVACGIVLEHAIRKAGSKAGAAVSNALRLTNLDTFYSNIQFDSRGLNVNRPLITIQLQKIEGEVVHVALWPQRVASGKPAIWPFPGW